jgi:PAS domain S-box-containing protein
MTQRKKLAIAYVFAVPVVLAVVLLQRLAFLRVDHVDGAMAQATEVLRDCDLTISLLREAELRQHDASASAASTGSYQDAVSQLRGVFQRLQLTGNEPSTQSQFRTLDLLIEERTGLLQSTIDLNKEGRPAVQNRAALEARGQKLSDDIGKLIAEIKTAQQIRLQQQRQAAAQGLRLASATGTYGGFLMIWLIGLAAFLLFHGERARAWKGVERRFHTRILEDLPLGVCLTTESGTIVYANHAEDDTFGYETGELIGKNVTRLHPSEGTEPVLREVMDGLGPSQIWSGELARRRKDTTTPNVTSWITNLDVAGKFYRVFIHDPYSRQDSQSSLQPSIGEEQETVGVGNERGR